MKNHRKITVKIQQIEAHLADLKELVKENCEEEFFSIGEWFTDQYGVKYLLSQIGFLQVVLISESGNRYSDPIKVKNSGKITKGELEKLSPELRLTKNSLNNF